jgi:hypothetical protein
LKKTKRAGVLNIQPLAMRSLSHSPSSSKCEEGKAYNECTRCYKGKKTHNHCGHNNTFGQRYSHFRCVKAQSSKHFVILIYVNGK